MPKNTKKERRQAYTRVVEIMQSNSNQGFNYKQLAHRVQSNNAKTSELIKSVLEELLSQKKIEELKKGKYRWKTATIALIGEIEFTSKGAAFLLQPDAPQGDIFISAQNTADAFNKDIVEVQLVKNKGKRREGKVLKVVERRKTTFVGTYEKSEDYGFVIPDDNKVLVDFFVPDHKSKKAKNGQKVLLQFDGWPNLNKNPFGKIIKVFGDAGEHNTEMQSILAEFGFTPEFPSAVEKEVTAITDKITDIAARKDFRKITTLTIDPADAKDFDDAISYQKVKEGHEVGVHIADVSHYVKEGTALDDEAFDRATSVYLVDRTIPMLPERLSNDLCSLKPHVDRPAFSAVFILDDHGNVKKEWFGKTVIHSDHRFSYDDALESIEGRNSLLSEELSTLNKLAHQLRKKKFENGAISFETDEVKFKLDKEGKPVEVVKKTRHDAHKMIEDFMLLANKKVAHYLGNPQKKIPIPYRIHPAPQDEKLGEFVRIAGNFGFKINTGSHHALAKSINEMVAKTENTDMAYILHPLAIRSMEKAVYTTKNVGHFGLGFEYYCHFTSPIRRYPDLLIHRILAMSLDNKVKVNPAELEVQCKHSSQMEQRATDAERASIKYKQAEYLSYHIGESFEGIISGVTDFGIFVELKENLCEGLIRAKNIPGDFFDYDEKEKSLVGRKTKKKFTLGDQVEIRVKNTDIIKRLIDFDLIW